MFICGVIDYSLVRLSAGDGDALSPKHVHLSTDERLVLDRRLSC